MHIKELEIEDFKSCAGKITIPFMKGFTTIAGPNGSGKSNIIDSILFCLGLSATKASIRVDSLKDFINYRSKHDRTSVKIIFADENDNDIMKVRREVKKTSAGYISAYQLNDKGSSLTEIHEQLLKYNVTPNSYNVLMQYEITKITAATPLNRRRILDEIAGVADFDRRIEQAMKELAVVEDRVSKSVIILDTINERLTVLKEQKELALKYQQLREEKAKYESQKSTVKYFDLKNSLERVHENILESNKNKKQQERELEKRDKELEKAKERLREISEKVKLKGEDEQLMTKAQINALNSTITSKQNTIDFEEGKKQQNLESIKNCKNNISQYEEKIEELRLKVDNKNDEIKSYEANIQQEKENLDRVTQDMENLSSQSNDNVKKRAELRNEIETKRDESNKILGEILPVKDEIRILERDINNAREIINTFDENNQAKLAEKDKLDVRIEELQKELKDYELAQKSLIKNLDDVKGQIDENNRNINLAFRKVTELETKQQTIATFSRNPAEFIMQAKIRGVHAPLAQLGKVEADVETALEVAMGGRMASVVVDDEDVAAVCIDTLKSARAGRVTFLPLNKIKRAPDNLNPPNINGVIDYAINLIDFDDKYYDAFYLALSDTLIVEDRLTAQKLLGKYRMVDLDGSLYDKSAAITGGSLAQNRMKFSTSENKELEGCKKKLRKFQDLADELDAKRQEIERKIEVIRGDYSLATSDLGKFSNQRDNLISELTNKIPQGVYKKNKLGTITSINIGAIVGGGVQNCVQEIAQNNIINDNYVEYITKNSATNIINNEAMAIYSVRSSEKDTEEKLLTQIEMIVDRFNKKYEPNAKATIKTEEHLPIFEKSEDNYLEILGKSAEEKSGVKIRLGSFHAGAETNHFASKTNKFLEPFSPALIGIADIYNMHSADEKIDVESFLKGYKLLKALFYAHNGI